MHITKTVNLLACFLLCVGEMNFYQIMAQDSSAATKLTYTRLLRVFLKDGNPDSFGAVQTELDGGNIAEDAFTGKQYWKLAEDDSIDFSFTLPDGIQKIEARIQCVSDADVIGKARIRWNSRSLQNEQGETQTLVFEGVNFSETVPLTEPDDQNTLRILVTEGIIGIQEVQLRCEIAYPFWNYDEVTITQIDPAPDLVFDGNPVTIKWATTGNPEGGWLKLEFRTTPDSNWQEVPGFDGITYGTDAWSSPNGEFVWQEPPQAERCELRFAYTKGEGPDLIREAEGIRDQKILTALAKYKWDFLREAERMVDQGIWREIAPEKRREGIRILGKLEGIYEIEGDNESAQDIQQTVELLDILDVLYCDAMVAMLQKSGAVTDEKEKKDIVDQVNNFIILREEAYGRARGRYEDDEETKKFLPLFFHRERRDALVKLIEDLTKQPQSEVPTASLIAANAKMIIVPDDTADLHEAIQQIALDGTIRILPGVYRISAPLQIDKNIQLIGSTGEPQDVTIESSGEGCLILTADHARIQGLTLQVKTEIKRIPEDQLPQDLQQQILDRNILALPDSEETGKRIYEQLSVDKSAVRILSGNSTLSRCTFTSNAGFGVLITGEKTTPSLERCKIFGCKRGGLGIDNHAKPSVVDCESYENALAGIEVTGMSDPKVNGCKFYSNNTSGIYVRKNSQGTFENCESYRNSAGIIVQENSNPVVRNCSFYEAEGRGIPVGICIGSKSRGLFESCDSYENLVGAWIIEESAPVFRRCKFYDNRKEGLSFYSECKGTLENCDVSRNASSGIGVRTKGEPTVRDCIIKNNKLAGIYIGPGGKGTYLRNTLLDNAGGSWHFDNPGSYTREGNTDDGPTQQQLVEQMQQKLQEQELERQRLQRQLQEKELERQRQEQELQRQRSQNNNTNSNRQGWTSLGNVNGVRVYRDNITGLEWTVSLSRVASFAAAQRTVSNLGFRLPSHSEFRSLERSRGIRQLGIDTAWASGFYWESSGRIVNGNGGNFASLLPATRVKVGNPYVIGVR